MGDLVDIVGRFTAVRPVWGGGEDFSGGSDRGGMGL